MQIKNFFKDYLPYLLIGILFSLILPLQGCSIPSHDNVIYGYSGKHQACFKQNIIFSEDYVGSQGNQLEVPLSECDDIIGFKSTTAESGLITLFDWVHKIYNIGKYVKWPFGFKFDEDNRIKIAKSQSKAEWLVGNSDVFSHEYMPPSKGH